MHPHLRILLFFFLFYSGVSKAQMVTTVAGTGEMGFLDGPVDTAKFNFPAFLAMDSVGNIYVSDKLNYRIRKIDIYRNTVSSFVGSIRGYSDGNTLTARFDEPIGLTFSRKGDLFITDYKNSTIRVFHPSTKSSEHFAGRPLSFGLVDGKEGDVRFKRPSAIIEGFDGNFYISDHENHVIRQASPDGTVITYAGTGERGSVDGYRTRATFNQPHGLALDKKGNLFVSDRDNNRIRKITSNGHVSTISGSVAGYRDGPAEQALFNAPNAHCIVTSHFKTTVKQ